MASGIINWSRLKFLFLLSPYSFVHNKLWDLFFIGARNSKNREFSVGEKIRK